MPAPVRVNQPSRIIHVARGRIEVTEPGQVKEIIFREDDAPTETDRVDQNRARLNGFILETVVPEPSSALLLGQGGEAEVAALLVCQRLPIV